MNSRPVHAKHNLCEGERESSPAGRPSGPGRGVRAFTLIELLVVVGTAGVLAVMVFSARAGGGADAQALVCLNNLRQLQLAWRMYADDNGERIVRTTDSGSTATTLTDPNIGNGSWCHGRMDLEANGSSTNTALIAAGTLFPYVRSLQVYKCPADKHVTTSGAPTVRSVSMNCWLNPYISWNNLGVYGAYGSGYTGRNIYTLADMDTNPPANIFVVLDEAAKSINDAFMVVNVAPANHSTALKWADLPAAVHAGAGGFAFGDGHTETRKWTDPNFFSSSFLPGVAFTGPDLVWFSNRASNAQ